jgi:hypothetical protein
MDSAVFEQYDRLLETRDLVALCSLAPGAVVFSSEQEKCGFKFLLLTIEKDIGDAADKIYNAVEAIATKEPRR